MKFLFPLVMIMMIIPFHSCSTRKGMSYNQREKGHYRLYTFPEFKKKKNNPRYKKIVLASLNNLNGAINSKQHIFTDPIDKSTKVIEWGGTSAIKAYLDILRKKFPNQLIVVDSGSFMHQEKLNEKIIFLYNFLGIDVATLGLNEFSLNAKQNQNHLQKLIKQSNFPIIASNLVSLKTNKLPDWQNLKQAHITTINGVKVGVIGLFSPELATRVNQKKLSGLYFQNLPKTIIQTSGKLRRSGAQVIITLLHSEHDCTSNLSKKLNLPKEKVNFNFQQASFCESNLNEVKTVLSQLPPHTIDVVITSGKDSKSANVINSIPVMQNFGEGQYISWMEINYDTKLHRVASEKTHIFQPVQLCHKFFKDSQDCYHKEKNHDVEFTQAKFLNEPVILNVLP